MKNKNHLLIVIITVLSILLCIETIWIVKRVASEKHTKADNWDYDIEGDISHNFETALSDGSIEVWFQPIVDPESDEVIGAEALSRWSDGDDYISPAVFVPALEATGQVKDLDKNVFVKACELQKERLGNGNIIFPISVNLSVASSMQDGIADSYNEIFESYGLPDGCINIELTESIDGDSKALAEVVDAFHENGFLVEIDDFGAGYAAYSNLSSIEYDILKIDKSIIDEIGTKSGSEIAGSVIDMAHELGMKIIAEGVETKEQEEILKTMECDAVQGYYYSKPLPHDEFCKYLDEIN
nr:EAL domain-containing protein [Clostridia bacterium]